MVMFCKTMGISKRSYSWNMRIFSQTKVTSENRLPRTMGQSYQVWFLQRGKDPRADSVHPGSAPPLVSSARPHRQPQKWNQRALRYVRIKYQGNDIIRRDGQLPVTLLPRRVGLRVLRGQDHSCRSCQDTSTGSWKAIKQRDEALS